MSFILFVYILAAFFSFFVAGALLGALFSKPIREKLVEVLGLHRLHLLFSRSEHNPVLQPGTNYWTAEAVLNPAALILGDRTHLIYRSIGADGVSRLGYASSKDGLIFDERLPAPAYVAHNPTSPDWRMAMHKRMYSPIMYASGGSWGGCEDPRMVAIDGHVYVTFNMFQDWALRVAYISLSEEDFLAKRFYRWDGPHLLSHSARDKNWVLFPEKIGGRFAVLHSIIGDSDDRVRIEYTDSLKTLSKRTFESPDPQQVPDRSIAWHVHVRSAGPPPLKTSRGWLVFYHANDAQESHRYKLGAMLLDLVDPTKIIARAHAPVLEPDSPYENAGKPGIIYACGATIQHGHVYIYYGGADKVVCVATAHLEHFLDALIKGRETEIELERLQTT